MVEWERCHKKFMFYAALSQHTDTKQSFVLVIKSGVIVWRHDYGPCDMSMANDEIMAAVKQTLGE